MKKTTFLSMFLLISSNIIAMNQKEPFDRNDPVSTMKYVFDNPEKFEGFRKNLFEFFPDVENYLNNGDAFVNFLLESGILRDVSNNAIEYMDSSQKQPQQSQPQPNLQLPPQSVSSDDFMAAMMQLKLVAETHTKGDLTEKHTKGDLIDCFHFVLDTLGVESVDKIDITKYAPDLIKSIYDDVLARLVAFGQLGKTAPSAIQSSYQLNLSDPQVDQIFSALLEQTYNFPPSLIQISDKGSPDTDHLEQIFARIATLNNGAANPDYGQKVQQTLKSFVERIESKLNELLTKDDPAELFKFQFLLDKTCSILSIFPFMPLTNAYGDFLLPFLPLNVTDVLLNIIRSYLSFAKQLSPTTQNLFSQTYDVHQFDPLVNQNFESLFNLCSKQLEIWKVKPIALDEMKSVLSDFLGELSPKHPIFQEAGLDSGSSKNYKGPEQFYQLIAGYKLVPAACTFFTIIHKAFPYSIEEFIRSVSSVVTGPCEQGVKDRLFLAIIRVFQNMLMNLSKCGLDYGPGLL